MDEREITKNERIGSSSEQDLSSRKEKFLAKKLEILYSAIPSSLLVNILNGAVLLTVLWGSIPLQYSVSWYLLLLLITAARYSLTKHFKKLESRIPNTKFWTLSYLLGTFLSGAIWGAAGILYFSTEFSFQLVFTCFLLGGMCAGALAVLSAIKEIAYLYILASMTPITIQFFIAGETYYSMAVLCLIFMSICFITVNRNNKSIDSVLNLQFENSNLLEFYKQEKEKAQQLNEELQGQIDLRKLTENELHDLTKVAESTHRAKNDFLGSINQTLGTPANAILGAVKILLDNDSEKTERETLYTIKHSAEMMLTTINEISDFSKIETNSLEIKRTPTAIRELVHETFRIMCSKANDKNISCTYRVDKLIPNQVTIDGIRVKQVLNTLISNALDLVEKDSNLAITCERIIENTNDKILFKIDCQKVIKANQVQSSILNSFQPADKKASFNLAISAALVELMNGDIKSEKFRKRRSLVVLDSSY